MKKQKIIPAFINKLTFNERRYLFHSSLAFLCTGMYVIWGFVVYMPIIFSNEPQYSWKFIGYCIILVLFAITWIKAVTYHKLIKKEPSNKQPKENTI